MQIYKRWLVGDGEAPYESKVYGGKKYSDKRQVKIEILSITLGTSKATQNKILLYYDKCERCSVALSLFNRTLMRDSGKKADGILCEYKNVMQLLSSSSTFILFIIIVSTERAKERK